MDRALLLLVAILALTLHDLEGGCLVVLVSLIADSLVVLVVVQVVHIVDNLDNTKMVIADGALLHVTRVVR